jgi:hypothetical protein
MASDVLLAFILTLLLQCSHANAAANDSETTEKEAVIGVLLGTEGEDEQVIAYVLFCLRDL